MAFCFGGPVKKTLCRKAASVEFWDAYAKWYRLWIDHTNYHARAIDVLTTLVEPQWRVLDIGAGSGVLSMPLCAIECDVTALEPSVGMRGLLYEEAFKRGIDRIRVSEERWEDVPCDYLKGYDLIMASNSLHLTSTGFAAALHKTFAAEPRNVFLVTELGPPEISVKRRYGCYSMAFEESYETESSFAYHHMEDFFEHLSFKMGRLLSDTEKTRLSTRLAHADGHYWDRDRACVGLYWWKKDGEDGA